MITKSNARRSKFSCLYSSHTRTPAGIHNNKSSSTNGLSYTSIALPGCLGPWISASINIYFLFMHSQEERLNIQRVTGHVLWLLSHSPNGFIPSVLKPNLMFFGSLSKSGNCLSMFLHWDPSVGCLISWSCLHSSLCHRINLAFVLFLNKRFKHGIIRKYHITLAGTFSLAGSPSTSPGSFCLILYRFASLIGHASSSSYSLW